MDPCGTPDLIFMVSDVKLLVICYMEVTINFYVSLNTSGVKCVYYQLLSRVGGSTSWGVVSCDLSPTYLNYIIRLLKGPEIDCMMRR